jgi:hypothetical protein
MALNAAVVFLSAFLLFLVQPIIAKMILPRFGGSVAVWATCLVFFQAALLLGYAFAHRLVRNDHRRGWRLAHAALLIASLAMLPIVPAAAASSSAAPPALQILGLLVLTVGLPFTLLATTSPLLQAWLARDPATRHPYRLFALSNLASLAALLAYPWLIEPWLPTKTQAWVWSAGYAAYVGLVGWAAWRRLPPPAAGRGAPAAPAAATQAAGRDARFGAWFALSALGSYALLAVTNHLTQNIPSFPMMWVLPLVIYLLSFTLAFDADRWYLPRAYRAATGVALAGVCAMLVFERKTDATVWPIAFFLTALFAICMFAHGELARSRPEPQRLTRFYLAVSAGGVAGGALVALAAPALLPGYFEVEIGLVAVAAALLWRCWPDGPAWRAAALLILAATAATGVWRVHDALQQVIAIDRNFYGVLRVREYGGGDPDALERVLVHGRILHGQQFLAEARRRQPTSYYAERSGIGRLLQTVADRPIEVAAIGLGVGTIATYGKAGDRYRFYEIDPAVPPAARKHFTYLDDSPAEIEIAVGDGRLLLQAEGERRFDVIVVDAFSGDAIPVHLLTREAVQLYLQRLKPGGVIALHLSNTYLDLRGVAAGIAAELGLQAAWIGDPGGGAGDPSRSSSDWVLLARERDLFDAPLLAEAAAPLPPSAGLRTWTDDYSHIVGVMKIGRAPAAD